MFHGRQPTKTNEPIFGAVIIIIDKTKKTEEENSDVFITKCE